MNYETVKWFADEMIRKNSRYRSVNFTEMIPARLLDMEVTDDNFDGIIRELNAICASRVNEFRKMIGLDSPKNNLSKEKKRRKLSERLNRPYWALPAKQESKRGEIKFLLSLASVIDHQ